MRRRAAQWLSAEAEKRENLEVVRTPDQPEEIVAELRTLSRKALPEQEPARLEAVPETPGEE